MTRREALALLGACGASTLSAATQDDDVILRAMRDELARSKTIHLTNLEPPYFISYSLDDGETFNITATLGGIVSSRRDAFRLPEVEVRVGDYKFDNTNYSGSGMFGSRFDTSRFPLENDYGILRRYLWLATDGAYKSAVEAIARKRAALQNMAVSDQLDDFARAEPLRHVTPITRAKIDDPHWHSLARSISAIFSGFPKIKDSTVEINVVQSTHYQLNTEGTELRYSDRLAYLRIKATAQAADGMSLHDAVVFHSHDPNQFPAEPELRRGAHTLAENLTKLTEAPVGETYNGPILFEGASAAQLLAETLGKNLGLPRRPVSERGRGGFFQPSELEGRQGSRIMPESMTVVDDPTQTEWRGRQLFGTLEVDREGVAPKPLTLVAHPPAGARLFHVQRARHAARFLRRQHGGVYQPVRKVRRDHDRGGVEEAAAGDVPESRQAVRNRSAQTRLSVVGLVSGAATDVDPRRTIGWRAADQYAGSGVSRLSRRARGIGTRGSFRRLERAFAERHHGGGRRRYRLRFPGQLGSVRAHGSGRIFE